MFPMNGSVISCLQPAYMRSWSGSQRQQRMVDSYRTVSVLWTQAVASMPTLFMVALWNRETIYIFILFLLLLSSFFSSPNLSSRRLDVYHTSAHGVVLV